MTERPKVTPRRDSTPLCPYCREPAVPLPQQDSFVFQVAPCPQCAHPHHVACAVENGGCASCGWRQDDPKVTPAPPPTPALSPAPKARRRRRTPIDPTLAYGAIVVGATCTACGAIFSGPTARPRRCAACIERGNYAEGPSCLWILVIPPLLAGIAKALGYILS